MIDRVKMEDKVFTEKNGKICLVRSNKKEYKLISKYLRIF